MARVYTTADWEKLKEQLLTAQYVLAVNLKVLTLTKTAEAKAVGTQLKRCGEEFVTAACIIKDTFEQKYPYLAHNIDIDGFEARSLLICGAQCAQHELADIDVVGLQPASLPG